MTARPYSIRMFLPDGDPDGLRIINRSNWTGVGVVFPRGSFTEVRGRDEFIRTGVYILVGQTDGSELPTIYIGEGDPVRPRLESHYSKKEFWTWAVFFTTTDNSLNKAHIQYLETRLTELASKAKRAKLDNIQTPQKATLLEWEIADMESFLDDIRGILPLIGLNVFDTPKVTTRSKRALLYIKAKGIEARGNETTEGFVVLKGSAAVVPTVKSIHAYLLSMRKDLVEAGVLEKSGEHYVFTQDYTFNSPSTAAGVVQGRSANGRVDWQDASGRTLKAIQSAESGVTDDPNTP